MMVIDRGGHNQGSFVALRMNPHIVGVGIDIEYLYLMLYSPPSELIRVNFK